MSFSAENVIRALALAISNAAVYGAEHAVTRQSVQACFASLQEAWKAGDVSIHLAEHGITVNHHLVEPKNRLAQHFAEHLEEREVTNFTLKKEMSQAQLQALIEVLNAKPQELEQLQGFQRAIAAVGLGDAVDVRKAVYREVGEYEDVVTKSGSGEAEETHEPVWDISDDDAGRIVDRAQIIDFLRGKEAAGTDEIALKVRAQSDDIDQLADLILEVADGCVSETSSPGQQRDTGSLVAECLRRMYQAMIQDPSFHTQKTKKHVQRTLKRLEDELLRKLQAVAPDPDAEHVVKDTAEELIDELAIDALAGEYVRKRDAAQSSEKRMLRFLKRKLQQSLDHEEIKRSLQESGLDEDHWQELLQKSGVSGLQPAQSEPVPDVSGNVSGILTKIEKDVRDVADAAATALNGKTHVSIKIPVNVLREDLQAARDQIDRIIRQTEARIANLVEEVGGVPKNARAAAAKPKLSRKRLFEILAEIGQELCQPLSVINCSIDMVRGGSLGEIVEVQREMLDMAYDSGQKLKILIDRLIAIAGTPKGLDVDKSIQSALYTEQTKES